MKIKVYVLFSLLIIALVFGPNVISAENNQNYSVLLKEEVDYEAVKLKMEQKGIKVIYEIPEIKLLQIKGGLSTIRDLDSIEEIETYNESMNTDSPRHVSNAPEILLQRGTEKDLWERQWDMKEITNNGESYKVFQGTKNVTVGIVDSGVSREHPDIKNNIVLGSKNLVPKNGWKNSESEESGDINQIDDRLGHGTSVAGQITANGLMKGVAPGVGVKAYRVFGGKSAEAAWVVKGIIEAAKDDVDVINLSLGEYLLKDGVYSNNGKNDAAEVRAYKKAIHFAYKHGSIVVAAAGNDGVNVKDQRQLSKLMNNKLKDKGITVSGTILDMPGALPKVVTVGSTGPTGELSLFSNYGEGFLDIVAPGGDYRLLNKYGQEHWLVDGMLEKEFVLTTSMMGGYYYDCGTSIATPKVSGALALIIEKNNWKDKPNQSIRHLYKYGVGNKITTGEKKLNIYNALIH
ncbi:S8 family peptidase [Bacillus cereus]|uniref:S8 family peptidase n=1 Tax=Bacillus cereus TaxID=1396 RepID=UPI0018794708|nr:S8 family serine peptidase [Bacillus cereus]MBE7099298.1 S8 family serine peptidase [Bacillus cereus]